SSGLRSGKPRCLQRGAVTKSKNRLSFVKNLEKTRYIHGDVDYLKRRHFFSDRYATSPLNAMDITKMVSKDYISVPKMINLKTDGTRYIPELPITRRTITYIPTEKINSYTLALMQTGDLIGIYSDLDGLDVSHIGVLIKKNNNDAYYRSASSIKKNMKVTDIPFLEYIEKKPGIVVLRPI
ncbi:DUF1460 domain-containing protein, partial [Neisseriaceae bacterium PsAf]|nr:DUF1460 domain-containing protein [Neisseriaceae bacterium PsAf]MCV2503015.1 DUF1460 domain-containing protein [Neisseriaceae bacterium]